MDGLAWAEDACNSDPRSSLCWACRRLERGKTRSEAALLPVPADGGICERSAWKTANCSDLSHLRHTPKPPQNPRSLSASRDASQAKINGPSGALRKHRRGAQARLEPRSTLPMRFALLCRILQPRSPDPRDVEMSCLDIADGAMLGGRGAHSLPLAAAPAGMARAPHRTRGYRCDAQSCCPN